jgi:hypothetical protein
VRSLLAPVVAVLDFQLQNSGAVPVSRYGSNRPGRDIPLSTATDRNILIADVRFSGTIDD